MRAIVVERLGGPQVLAEHNLPIPVPGPGEVLVRVAYAGVNFSEVYARRGQTPGFMPPFVPGLEIAGVVAATGECVERVAVGDPVTAFSRRGGYAEYALAAEQLTFRLPSGDDAALLTGASFPTTVCTAWLMLSRAVRLARGETMLVHAAAGALGLALAAVGRELGAGRIIGTTSTSEKAEFARAHGYDELFLRDSWLERAAETGDHGRIDAAVETVSAQTFRETLAALAPLGRVVACGDAAWSEDPLLSRRELWMTNRAVVGFNIGGLSELRTDVYQDEAQSALAAVVGGRLSVPIDAVLPLAEAGVAHARLDRGENVGKLVLRVAGGR